MEQLVLLVELPGLDGQDHLVDAAGVGDLDLPPLDLLEPGHDLLDLMRVHEHALDAGRGVHAAHDAAQARAGSAASARGAVQVAQVARGQPDERVGFVERGDHHLADLAVLERDAGVRVANLHVGAVGQVQPVLVEALVTDAAHVRRAIALAHDAVELLLQGGAHLLGEFLARDKGHFQEQVLAQGEPHFLGLLGQVHQVAGRTHVTGHAQLLHDLDLRVCVAGPGGHHGAGQVAQGLLEHQSGRGQVVVESNLGQVAGAEAGGVEALGPAPVVLAAVLGIEDRAGGEEYALEFAQVLGQQPAQPGPHGLEEDKLLLLDDGDVLEVVERAELVHVELCAVKALLDVLGVSVGIGEQLLELELAVLSAFRLVEYLAPGINPFCAVFSGHMYAPVWIICRLRQGAGLYHGGRNLQEKF